MKISFETPPGLVSRQSKSMFGGSMRRFAAGATAAGVGGVSWLVYQQQVPVSMHAETISYNVGSLSEMRLFTGNANPDLASDISDSIGIPLSNMTVTKFADGEVRPSLARAARTSYYKWLTPRARSTPPSRPHTGEHQGARLRPRPGCVRDPADVHPGQR